MKLYHVSENPDIEIFEPRFPSNKDAGVQKKVVWAVHENELTNYLLPRECPRICYWNEFHQKIISVEKGWLERINSTVLYLYQFPSASFVESDSNAGYWVSEEVVKPLMVIEMDSLVGQLEARNVILKTHDHLHNEKEFVLANYTAFSMIRLRNAIPKA